MFNAISSLFSDSSPSYDSVLLLINRSPSGYSFIHPVPEDSEVVEEFTKYSGNPSASLTLPGAVKAIRSREELGSIVVRVTEGETFADVSSRLALYVKRLYNADVEAGAGGADEGMQKLERSERALRQGFKAIVEENEKRQSEGSGALPVKYNVELIRISRKKPGRIVDDTDLTSFPKQGPAL
ncbi:hypothetical protein C8Q75DRAFT_890162 [Abortiporus biennis]|nr:hypothetical protein C8Q75DRAFT_890162 [Abortiporus biennis]